MLRWTLTALIPVWIFGFTSLLGRLLVWLQNDKNENLWWSIPAWMALGLPILFLGVAGLEFVLFLWIEAARP